ncbi:MAG: hypothetical protein FWH32_01895 [Clostridiales bacterium]|nr:hypothetical protein [Clostridiales bacterium]
MDYNELASASVIREGETLIWKGKTSRYELLDEDNKKGTLLIWIASAAVAIVLVIMYAVFTADLAFAPEQAVIYAMLVGFPLIFFVDPIRDRAAISKQILMVTDKRIIIFHKSTNTESGALSMNIANIDNVRVEKKEPGFGRILFGSATFEAKGLKLRRMSIVGAHDKDDKLAGMVYYRLPESDIAIICSALNREVEAV